MLSLFWKAVSCAGSFVFLISALVGGGVPERKTADPVEDGKTRIMSFNVRCGEYKERKYILPELIAQYRVTAFEPHTVLEGIFSPQLR